MQKSFRRGIPLTAIGAVTIHPERQNISFGRWAIPVMAKKMEDSDPLERRKAVKSMCDYVFDSRRVASKEFASVVPVLRSLQDDEDVSVRAILAECFAAITASAAGRQTFHKHDFYEEALKLVEDNDETVRHAANIVLQRISLSPIGAESLVAAGGIQKLVERIPQEPENTLVILLQTLHACCLVDAGKCLNCNGLEAVTPLLESSDPSLKEKAATVIKDLTVEADGRSRALETSALTLLLNLCNDEDEMVQAKALSALMMIANATPAKFMAIEKNAIEKILPLVKKTNVEIRLNSIKVLTALGEAPPGRKALLENRQKVLNLLNDKVPQVQKAAKKLVAVMEFRP